MSFESTTSLFFFAPPKMFKILKNESWFSEKLFELNLKSMESLKFFQKITSKTHIENTPKKKQKKKSVFSENWSNARCTSKYHFFAEISQKFHAFTFTFTFFSSLYNNIWKICSCWSYIFSPKSPKNCTHWTLHSHLHLPFSVLYTTVWKICSCWSYIFSLKSPKKWSWNVDMYISTES